MYNLFLHKYNQLYNSVHSDDTEMSTLSDENVNDIHVHCIGTMTDKQKSMGDTLYFAMQ